MHLPFEIGLTHVYNILRNKPAISQKASLVKGNVIAVHNVYFVKYIFPRNRTSSDLS